MVMVWIVFIWLLFCITWTVFKMIRDYLIAKGKAKKIRYKQIIMKNGKKYFRIDYLSKGLRR